MCYKRCARCLVIIFSFIPDNPFIYGCRYMKIFFFLVFVYYCMAVWVCDMCIQRNCGMFSSSCNIDGTLYLYKCSRISSDKRICITTVDCCCVVDTIFCRLIFPNACLYRHISNILCRSAFYMLYTSMIIYFAIGQNWNRFLSLQMEEEKKIVTKAYSRPRNK